MYVEHIGDGSVVTGKLKLRLLYFGFLHRFASACFVVRASIASSPAFSNELRYTTMRIPWNDGALCSQRNKVFTVQRWKCRVSSIPWPGKDLLGVLHRYRDDQLQASARFLTCSLPLLVLFIPHRCCSFLFLTFRVDTGTYILHRELQGS